MKNDMTVSEMARLGGLASKGRTSERKRESSRRNAATARAAIANDRQCERCPRPIRPNNRSGICRICQRSPNANVKFPQNKAK